MMIYQADHDVTNQTKQMQSVFPLCRIGHYALEQPLLDRKERVNLSGAFHRGMAILPFSAIPASLWGSKIPHLKFDSGLGRKNRISTILRNNNACITYFERFCKGEKALKKSAVEKLVIVCLKMS